MKHPWQIWTLYAACLAIALPALGWLSLQALELDRARELDRQQTELARREAELQERISSALWRMDGLLTPLIAQEAARPYYLYESFYRSPAQRNALQPQVLMPPQANVPPQTATQAPVQTAQLETASQDDDDSRSPIDTGVAADELTSAQPSPLLVQPSEFVFLHFQIGPNNDITSPQRPTGLACQQAISCCGLTAGFVSDNDLKLSELQAVLDYDSLLALCPSDKLPNSVVTSFGDVTRNEGPGAGGDQPQLATFLPDPRVQAMQEKISQQLLADNDAAQGGYGQDSPSQQKFSEPQQKQIAQQSRNRSRGTDEFNKRLQSAGNYAMNQWMGNSLNNDVLTPNVFVNEGIMRPLWIGERLFLARRVESNQTTLIQGCWLDWEKIQLALRNEVADLLPDIQFQPFSDVADVRLGQALATLPVQLEIDRDQILSQLDLAGGDALSSQTRPSGIGFVLAIAWGCLGLAAVGGAFLLQGLIRLSERRGAFVSAVTHELRTPLTTFRMYAEMLAERMVPSPEKQQQYANTMRVEAERLSHLVENVLQFARLERTDRKCRTETVTWTQLVDRFADRLQQRADQAGMKLTFTIDPQQQDRDFQTDPAAMEQILFNLVDNACKYARDAEKKQIDVSAEFSKGRLRVSVRDYGPGVSPQIRRRMYRPFCKSDQEAADTAQGVGLGLALCQRMAKSLGGRLSTGSVDPGTEIVLDIPA